MLFIIGSIFILPLAFATTFNVTVALGGELNFCPQTLTAAVGDQVCFVFHSGNHTVTQSSFDTPCVPIPNGFDSGFEPVEDSGSDLLPTYEINITDSAPVYIYSQSSGACGEGMVLAINTPADTYSEFQARANLTGSENVTDTVPAATEMSSSTSTVTTNSGGPTDMAIGPVDHLIVVGQDGELSFGPTNIMATIGDTVTFEFHPKNHSVIQSSYMNPCRPLEDTDGILGFRPGFVPLSDDTTEFPRFQIRIQNARPIWGYCGQVNHCAAGMLFAINALDDGEINFAAFVERARMINGTDGVNQPAPTSKYKNGVRNRVSPNSSLSFLIYMMCFYPGVATFALEEYSKLFLSRSTSS